MGSITWSRKGTEECLLTFVSARLGFFSPSRVFVSVLAPSSSLGLFLLTIVSLGLDWLSFVFSQLVVFCLQLSPFCSFISSPIAGKMGRAAQFSQKAWRFFIFCQGDISEVLTFQVLLYFFVLGAMWWCDAIRGINVERFCNLLRHFQWCWWDVFFLLREWLSLCMLLWT